MRKHTALVSLVVLLAAGCATSGAAGAAGALGAAPQFPVIDASTPLSNPPAWALLEREIITAMNGAVEPLLAKYVRADGSVMWPPVEENFQSIDALDDAYESFHNWPLLYILGGDEKLLRYAHREFDAITEQFARYPTGNGYPMVVKEYQPGYDWFHQGEGNYLFYTLCLADPADPKNIARARRFAGFFMNEDPDALNYDPEHKTIKCAHNGSKGPAFWNFTADSIWTTAGYGLPFFDVPGFETFADIQDPEKMKRFAAICNARRGRGDAVINLLATSLATNAYLLTGDEKYKAWVREYTDAWIERAKQNGGILPDNVGLSGKIGEQMDGAWYGANYGWTWPHGWHGVGEAVVVSAENAALLTRDTAYMRFPRSQVDMLIALGVEKDGRLCVPHKHGAPGKVRFKAGEAPIDKDGWFEFTPMPSFQMAHVWNVSMDPQDMAREQHIAQGTKPSIALTAWHHQKDQGGHDAGWLAFMRGQYPTYPEDILRYNLGQVYGRLAFMKTDTEDPKKYGDWYLQQRNPVTCEGLVQLTLGSPLPVYNGGLLVASVRHFDPERRRPGLPPDVAALVEKLEAKRIVLQLVNLNITEARDVLVQAGGFGEHRFTEVKYGSRQGVKSAAVNGSHVQVHLPPASCVTLDMGVERYVNQPTYALPWDAH